MRKLTSVLFLASLLIVLVPGSLGAAEVIVERVPFPVTGDAYPANSALLELWGVVGDGQVDRHGAVNRAEFVQMAVRAFGRGYLSQVLEGLTPEMGDVGEIEQRYWGDVNLAAALGLIAGGENVRFRPGDDVTAVEALTVLVRGLGADLEGELPYPVGSLAAAEEKGLLEHLEGVLWDAELTREEVYCLLGAVVLEGSGGKVGVLYRLEGHAVHLFTEAGEVNLELAPRVYLAGAEGLEAVVGQMVYVHLDPEGRVGYVETGSEICSHRGSVEDYDLARGRLKVDDEWIFLDLGVSGAVTWECNGMPFIAPDDEFLGSQLEMWISQGAEVSVHLDGEGRGRVVVEYWDVRVAAVTDVREEGLELTYLYRNPSGGQVEESLHLDETALPSVCGDADSPAGIEEGDLIRMATVGGWGFEVHCIEVTRERVSGVLGGHRARHTRDGVTYYVEIDDREIEIPEGLFLGETAEVLDRSILTLALDQRGRGIYMVDGRRIGSGDPVMLMEFVETLEERLIEVDYRGTRLTFETDVSVGDLAVVMGSEGSVMSRVVYLNINEEGVVVDVAAGAEGVVDLDGDGLADDRVVVVSLNAEERCLTLRVDNPGGAPGYMVTLDPVIYDGEGQWREVGSLSPGDVLLPYEAGEVLLLLAAD